MPFTDAEIATYAALTEELIWRKHRPPLQLRDRIREGQRIAGSEVELFLVRPMFHDPTRHIEESIAKASYVKSRDVWKVYWKRADLKWHPYPPRPEVKTLTAFLTLVDEDANCCFWG